MKQPSDYGRGATLFHKCIAAGRLLILLVGLLLVVMPWTEYFWHFDRFMRGGQDFELSLLAVMLFLCLIVVLLQRGKSEVLSLLDPSQLLPGVLPGVLRGSLYLPMCFCHYAGNISPVPLPLSGKCSFSLPIQV